MCWTPIFFGGSCTLAATPPAARAARFAADCCGSYGAFGHPLPIKESGLFTVI